MDVNGDDAALIRGQHPGEQCWALSPSSVTVTLINCEPTYNMSSSLKNGGNFHVNIPGEERRLAPEPCTGKEVSCVD